MKFGLESFVFGNFFSVIISILLLLGCYALGKVLIYIFNINRIISSISSNSIFQENIIGLNFLLIIIFPLVQYALLPVSLIFFLAFALIVSGIFYLYLLIKKTDILYLFKKLIYKNNKFFFFYLCFFIIGYFLLSLGPTTNADSLDYHLYAPLHYLNFQTLPNQYSYFHGKLVGAGEIVNLIGLSVRAEQFSSLVQYSCLISIIGLITTSYKKKYKSNLKDNLFLILCILSCPVIIFFLTSSKLQFFPVATNAFCFAIIFFCFDNLKKKDYLYCFILFNLLIAIQIEIKHSFILSSFILWTIFLYKTINKKFYFSFILISLICFLLVLLPNILWKIIQYRVDLIDLLRFNLPVNYPGYQQFFLSLSSCGYYCWPTWIFLPKNINEFSNSLGLSSLLFFIIIKHLEIKDFRYLLVIIIVFFSFGLSFGPSSPRFFIDPFIWLVLIVSYYYRYIFNDKFFIFFKRIIIFYSYLIFLAVYFGVFTNSIGSINKYLRNKIMQNNANGYELFKWAGEHLPQDARLLSLHRSVSLSSVRTFPADFINYINSSDQRIEIYLNEIKKEKINFILLTNESRNNIFSNCTGKLHSFKKDISATATRNPFNKGKEKYDAYIYEFNYSLLPGCVFKKF